MRIAAALAATALAGGCADLQGIDLGAFGGPSQSRIAAGLRQALQLGTERAVAVLSRPGGFAEKRGRQDHARGGEDGDPGQEFAAA